MLRLREKTGEREARELRIAEELCLAGVDDIDNTVVLLGLYLVGLRRDWNDEAVSIAREDDLAPVGNITAENVRAEVVDLVPDVE